MENNYGVCISVTGKGSTDHIRQKPPWLRVRIPAGDLYAKLREKITARGLHTVCDEARCPNVAECWGKHGTATIMIMGRVCTRSCRFCAVTSGIPQPLDPGEPERVARAISDLGLKYVVLTSVCRDDLDDGGALHFTRTVREVRNVCPGVRVEVLVPDFGGNTRSIRTLAEVKPDVIGHNIETVERLTPIIRDRRASYNLSLKVLSLFHEYAPESLIKSSIMLGLGETYEEILATMKDLRGAGVHILTMGQYLRPSMRHHPVVEYLPPEQFDRLKKDALALGFSYVVSGPLVRSSYHALEAFEKV